MTKKILFIILAFVTSICYSQQTTAVSKSVSANNILTKLANPQGFRMTPGETMVWRYAEEPGGIVGDPYWDIHWGNTTILLYENEKLVEGYLTRFDIHKSELEFRFEKEIKVLPGKLIKNIVWLDSITHQPRYLVNAQYYQIDQVPLVGFMEVLADGTHALFKRMEIEVLKPNYNAALNVGSKDTKIVKREFYYFNTGNQLYKIKSKKSLQPLSQGREQEIDSFLTKENIKFSNEKDLIKLFTYLNSKP